jgi:hypothetical protein
MPRLTPDEARAFLAAGDAPRNAPPPAPTAGLASGDGRAHGFGRTVVPGELVVRVAPTKLVGVTDLAG